MPSPKVGIRIVCLANRAEGLEHGAEESACCQLSNLWLPHTGLLRSVSAAVALEERAAVRRSAKKNRHF